MDKLSTHWGEDLPQDHLSEQRLPPLYVEPLDGGKSLCRLAGLQEKVSVWTLGDAGGVKTKCLYPRETAKIPDALPLTSIFPQESRRGWEKQTQRWREWSVGNKESIPMSRNDAAKADPAASLRFSSSP